MIFKNINTVFNLCFYFIFYLFLEFILYSVCIIKGVISVFKLSEQFKMF